MTTHGLLRDFGRNLLVCRSCGSQNPFMSLVFSRTFRWYNTHRSSQHVRFVGSSVLGNPGFDPTRRGSGWTPVMCQSRGVSDGVGSGVEWSRAMSEAEKIVGYPTSFMSLRCLLSDEISNLAIHMRKLVGSKHPLVDTARRFIYDGTHSLQMRGLLVLLLAKAAGPTQRQNSDVTESMVSGIYPSQRSLAEITEMIHTAFLVHKGVVNLPAMPPSPASMTDMQFGNKMSVLCGDFLLANASTALAQLYNTKVVELVSSAIADLATAEFTQLSQEEDSHSLPSGGANVDLWERQTFLSSGSLLAKSCQAVMLLAQHEEGWQQEAYSFGRSMGFAYQLHEELSMLLQRVGSETKSPSLSSMPVILHLEKRPEDADLLQGLTGKPGRNQQQIYDILSTTGSINEARERTHRYRQEALQSISVFGESDASAALANIVKAVTDV